MIFSVSLAQFDRFDCLFLLTPLSLVVYVIANRSRVCVCMYNRGTASDTRGTAYVVFEDIFDAKNALEHLSGFNVGNRYLVVVYHQQSRMLKRMDTEKKKQELDRLKKAHGIGSSDAPPASSSK